MYMYVYIHAYIYIYIYVSEVRESAGGGQHHAGLVRSALLQWLRSDVEWRYKSAPLDYTSEDPQLELLPVHSPLLGEFWSDYFSPLSDMLKFIPIPSKEATN